MNTAFFVVGWGAVMGFHQVISINFLPLFLFKAVIVNQTKVIERIFPSSIGLVCVHKDHSY